MLKIRLQRTGRTNDPSYRIVVLEHTQSTKAGDVVEKVGTYNPKTKEQNLNAERIKYWISVGAQPSETMHNMLISAGVIEGKKVNVLPRKSPPKKEEEAAAEGAPAAEGGSAAPVAEASGEEAAAEPAKKEEAKTEEKPAEEASASEEAGEKKEAPEEPKKEEEKPAEAEADKKE